MLRVKLPFSRLIIEGKEKASQLIRTGHKKKEPLDLTALIDEVEGIFKSEAIFIPPTKRSPNISRRELIERLVKVTFAVKLVHHLPLPPKGYCITLENWSSDVLKTLDLSDAYILTLLKINKKGVSVGNDKLEFSLGSVYIFYFVISIDAKYTNPRYRTAYFS